jgi:hypothetical protein
VGDRRWRGAQHAQQRRARLANVAEAIVHPAIPEEERHHLYSPAPKGWSHCVASPNEAQGLL